MASGNTAHINFELLELAMGQSEARCEADREIALVIMSGECRVRSGDQVFELKRSTVFDELASAVYLPPSAEVSIEALADSKIAWCAGLADLAGEPRMIRSDEVTSKIVGRDSYERTVCDIIDADFPAQHLVLGETFNQPGKWSSYPPHRHDEDRLPEEADMEEIYFFKVNPESGFGFQRIYSPEAGFDRAIVLKDETVVEVPEGYHPVSAAPGCDVYYLWVLWGEKRILAPFDDPAFASVRARLDAEATV